MKRNIIYLILYQLIASSLVLVYFYFYYDFAYSGSLITIFFSVYLISLYFSEFIGRDSFHLLSFPLQNLKKFVYLQFYYLKYNLVPLLINWMLYLMLNPSPAINYFLITALWFASLSILFTIIIITIRRKRFSFLLHRISISIIIAYISYKNMFSNIDFSIKLIDNQPDIALIIYSFLILCSFSIIGFLLFNRLVKTQPFPTVDWNDSILP